MMSGMHNQERGKLVFAQLKLIMVPLMDSSLNSDRICDQLRLITASLPQVHFHIDVLCVSPSHMLFRSSLITLDWLLAFNTFRFRSPIYCDKAKTNEFIYYR
jgi:hypothetical protein